MLSSGMTSLAALSPLACSRTRPFAETETAARPVIRDPTPAGAPARAGVAEVRGLILEASLGVYLHERRQRQRVRIDLAAVIDDARFSERLSLCLAQETRSLLGEGHITLVETMAERIAARCLATEGVEAVRVRVEKMDIVAEAAGIGVEICRFKPAC